MTLNERLAVDGKAAILLALGTMIIAAQAIWFGIDYAFETSHRLQFVWYGQRASVLFIVARRTILNSVLVGGILLFLYRLLRARTNADYLGAFIQPGKLMLAVFATSSISFVLGECALCLLPASAAPIPWLGEWRPFQIANLIALILALPISLVVLEKIQAKVIAAKSLATRIALVSAVILSVVSFRIAGTIDWDALRHRPQQQEPSSDGEEKIEHRNYRLPVDEPGEFKA